MSRIDIENAKILRPSMDVICGLDVLEGNIESIYCDTSYDGVTGATNGIVEKAIFMDLSGDGFLNDGNAVALPSTHNGILSRIGQTLILNFTPAEEYIYEGSTLTAYGYQDGELKSWTRYVEHDYMACNIEISASTSRIYITKLNIGKSWWFDNNNLISCNLQLRGVETTLDNPSLQMSEIEIKGYEPNDITDLIDIIDENNPIYYSAGYIGDMSTPRKFYLNDMVEWQDNIITIKGCDATKFLDADYAGKYYLTSSFQEALEDILDSAGISYTETGSEWRQMYPLLIPQGNARDTIAQIVNLVRGVVIIDMSGDLVGYTYVDAGIPTLKLGDQPDETDAIELTNIAELKKNVERQYKGMSIGIVSPVADSSWKTLQTVDMVKDNSYWIESQEPCKDFKCSYTTKSVISPYKVKFTCTKTGSYAVSGQVINSTAPKDLDFTTEGEVDWEVPQTISWREHGAIIDGGTIYCTGQDTIEWHGNTYKFSAIQYLIGKDDDVNPTVSAGYRSNVSYEFTYRGDPRLQPRDIIKVKIDNVDTIMTIDNLTLEHEAGGLTSKIVARKGLV